MSRWLGRRGRLGVLRSAGAVIAVAAAAACGGGSDDADAGDTTTTEKARTTTSVVETTTTGSPGGDDPWLADAQEHRGDDGTEVDYDCPADGTLDTIWGTETYTDDSSVCSAAVHVGLITVADGGTVTIEIAPGEDAYEGAVANDVTSLYYASWSGSFVFPDAPPGSGDFEASPASWSQNATGLSPGDSRTVRCSAGGPPASIWGTGTYTGDSSICTAAVHAGLITLADGGEVTIDVTDGEDAYTGSSENGITSSSYATYALSYEFPPQL